MTDQLTLALAPPAGNLPPQGVPEEVAVKFEALALEVADAGFERYSADEILHRLRWHHNIEKRDRDFRVNNNWSAPLARWFLRKYPHLKGFFELRERKIEKVEVRQYVDD